MVEDMIEPVLAQLNIGGRNVVPYIVLFLMFGMPMLRALFSVKKKPARPTPQRRTQGQRLPGAPRGGPGSAHASAPAPGPVARSGPAAPAGGGLTMADRIAQARQAQQGSAARASAPVSGSRPVPTPRPAPAASAQRGPAAAAAAAAEARVRAQKAQARQRAQGEALAQRQRELVQRQRALREKQQRQAANQQADQYQKEHATHRLVEDADVMTAGEIGQAAGGAADKRRRGGARAVLNGNNLREAYILKEVLDRPVSLRDTQTL